ncbi:MAG: glycosyltransferase, partial [Holophaga sp.]|nr:glycosyltransferase [Holophaga sp.]
MDSARPRLLFLINSLNPGGAERQLCELVRSMDRDRFKVHVVVNYDPPAGAATGFYDQMAALPGVTLHSLHKRRGALGYGPSLVRLLALVIRFDPQILHGYMDGNLPLLLLGGLLRKRVVWGIRRTSADQTKLDRVGRWVQAITLLASPFVEMVIFNSEAGRLNHGALGMRSPRMCVVPNGFDVEKFHPDPCAGVLRRRDWGIPDGVPLVGIVGRLDPVKDHPTFLRAAARLSKDFPGARFVCIGHGTGAYLEKLRDLAASLGIGEKVCWPGGCADMTGAYNALSLLILCSTDEGFPNVLGEAMACGIPCVTTRVGDAEALAGGTGQVVEVGDDEALAREASRLLLEPPPAKAARSVASRERICTRY